jgi:tRNA A37 N6-isopentenylltransferase MiaA
MNERIKELLDWAKDHARIYVIECELANIPVVQEEYDRRFQEMFAELIVRECVEKLKETKKVELPFLQAVNEYAQELPLSVYIAELNGHFGVEE